MPGLAFGPPEPTRRDEPLAERVQQEIRSQGPGFAASVGLHALILFLLALIVVSQETRIEKPEFLAQFGADVGNAKSSTRRVLPTVRIESVRTGAEEDTGASAGAARSTTPAPGPPVPAIRRPGEVGVGGALASRGAGRRAGAVASQGGTDKSERAVAQGLAWLVRVQRPDGHWELHDGYPDPGQIRTDTGATALALLSFLGAGYTHREGPHRETVGKAIRWLLGVQKKSGPFQGDFYDFDREGDNASFYAHAQATMALGEACAMTGDATLRPAVQNGLAFIYSAQHPIKGGWKYRRGSEGDTSVFGWQIMAIETGRMAGLDVPPDVLDRAAGFLDLVQEEDGARYKYEANSRGPTAAMTAEGLFCRQYLGWPADHPALRDGVRYLMEPENLPRWSSGRRNVYLWYYAAQVLHNLQGDDWQTWNAAVREEIVSHQVKSGGRTGGSWHPFQPAGAPDENTDKGGRLYVTCLCLLTLEVYYRHVPLYGEADGTER